MWNKGLSYRERQGIGQAGMNKDTNSNVGDALNADTNKSHALHTDENAPKHSLGRINPVVGRLCKERAHLAQHIP